MELDNKTHRVNIVRIKSWPRIWPWTPKFKHWKRTIPFVYQDCGRVYEYRGREFSGFDGKKMQQFSFDWFYFFFFKDRDEIIKWEWGEER